MDQQDGNFKKYVEMWPEGRTLIQMKWDSMNKGTCKTNLPEMSDEELLRTTLEVEREKMTAGILASDVLFQANMMDGLHRWNEDLARAVTTVEADHQTYSGLQGHTTKALGMDVLKRKIIPSYTEPRKFTGELIGIVYLYSQTGKVNEDYQKAIKTLETEETITTDEEDLYEDTIQIDDLTISTIGLKDSSDIVLKPPVIPQTPVAVAAPSERNLSSPARRILKSPTAEEYESLRRDTQIWRTTEQPSDTDPTISVPEVTPVEDSGEEQDIDESVGPDGISWYGKMQEFAAYLIGVCHDLYLTNAQASQLINLWNNLYSYDKAPTVFAERFSREARGRFTPKNCKTECCSRSREH